MMKKIAVFAVVVALALFAGQAFAKDIKIGVSFSDFETERWPVEAELMKKLTAEQGAEVVVQAANHDAKLQNDQIQNMILQGVDVIIIIAEDDLIELIRTRFIESGLDENLDRLEVSAATQHMETCNERLELKSVGNQMIGKQNRIRFKFRFRIPDSCECFSHVKLLREIY